MNAPTDFPFASVDAAADAAIGDEGPARLCRSAAEFAVTAKA